jgi:hypothetical protein
MSYLTLSEVRLVLGQQGAEQVNHPKHYLSHPSGIETIQITEHMGFCLGNVIKYVLRAPYKGKELEDLKKARWYLSREIERLEMTNDRD